MFFSTELRSWGPTDPLAPTWYHPFCPLAATTISRVHASRVLGEMSCLWAVDVAHWAGYQEELSLLQCLIHLASHTGQLLVPLQVTSELFVAASSDPRSVSLCLLPFASCYHLPFYSGFA